MRVYKLLSLLLSTALHFFWLWGFSTFSFYQRVEEIRDSAVSLRPREKIFRNIAFAPALSLQQEQTACPEKCLPIFFARPSISPSAPSMSDVSEMIPQAPHFSLPSFSEFAPPRPPLSSLAHEESSPPTVPAAAKEKSAPPELSQKQPLFGHDPLAFSLLPPPPPLTISPVPARASLRMEKTISCSDAFDTELLLIPLEEREGYFFALTLIPRPDVQLPKVSQHYDFLVDTSHSITHERLHVTKQALLKAIEELSIDDTFSLIAFDSRIEKLSPNPLPGIPSSLRKAQEFLEKIERGSLFSSANLSKALSFTVPPLQDGALRTLFLFTDGEGLRKKNAQKELGLGWTAYNQGKVSLFCVGLEGDPHAPLLATLSALNRGKALFAPSERGIKRKFLKAMKTLAHPLLPNPSFCWVAEDSELRITLYPGAKEAAPHLYLTQPYLLFGTTNLLKPFTLFIQGKTEKGFLQIKKEISFAQGKVTLSLGEREWALLLSHELYARYLRTFDPEVFAELHALLDPLQLPVFFE
ncbi:MAG: VWA domain-containing protein [Verrucomicrobiota bacterium]|nr:VWA domain-containing protein [Verrucomicrobiota bacterium]